MDKTLFYEGVLDTLDMGISVYDNKGNFLFVNSYMLKYSDYTRREYLTKNAYDLEKEGVIDRSIVDEVYKTKKEVSFLQNVMNSKGNRQQIITALPVFGPDGQVQNVVCWMQNIQDYEERLNQARSSAAYNLRLKNMEQEAQAIVESPAMRELFAVAANVAAVDSNVLLLGESGAGKDVVARYLHNCSPRSRRKMVVVNCASLPENLLESELFGYEKGAFTGAATQGKRGLVEEAQGGTLFLDEINSLPLGLQAKLLRVLETKTIQPLGSLKSKTVDFRLITATNRDLAAAVEAGSFRADLYYRLNVIPLRVPPLRERKEDIRPLAASFLAYYSNKYGRPKEFSPAVYQELEAYAWPGNVRELKNFVERMVVVSAPDARVLTHIPEGTLDTPLPGPEPAVSDYKANRKQQEREMLERALAENGGHRGKTAEALGISRRSLQYKLKEHGLSSPRGRRHED